MSGDIWITHQDRFPTSNTLYHVVLDFLIDHAPDPGTRSALEEIRDHNLGLIDTSEFDSPAREHILGLLAHQLVPHAHAHLPTDMHERDQAITELQKLADIAKSHL
ncbi:hypothetical protein [Actinokineospora sp. UTMC 2448]|uniref:hypothetical protein n=1 Tax=Actinokineospora sp. UTMC 2448 TaxID=2268449 RepID=UPI0021642088|nr:hypothetical protein [Actinokineospora sp. UTMC 2448]UVS81432.1 hypothetical protein Actkin_05190 [Actinokineospora sp. UTMC 2448]